METLDATAGSYSGSPKPQPKPIGMDVRDFHAQVMGLVKDKVPLAKAQGAIDKHPDITDKPRAKNMARAIYGIVGSK